ncbi:universal stress protein [Halorubrum sp. GN11_10-6_MGM]|uniref:universal stress protein n=1 Tax=Halorubrum sp. GN11_10-6_MGM TaxID=2518112 RepID=UPI0010F64264|nr:universal stress protein [Halorubrum sp. GN11_10-6_MGM]TKX75577.1 universal stress protein [Halorubrum sp. GN11_10-6_MGM]
MPLYDRILVPTDGSSEGELAVCHALDLAAVHGASVRAIYVVDTARYAGMPMETTWEGVGDLLYDDAESALETVEALAADRDVDVETAAVEGSPSREIITHAEEAGCDLVVMGTHGRGGIDRLLLGSVAEKVVRGSSVPVLTVRIGDEEAADVAESATASGAAEAGESAAADETGATRAEADGSVSDATETG